MKFTVKWPSLFIRITLSLKNPTTTRQVLCSLPYVSEAYFCFRSTARPNPCSYCRRWQHSSSHGQPPLSYLLTNLLPWLTSSIVSTDSLLLIQCQQCVCHWANETMLMCSCLKRGTRQRTHTEDLMRIALMHKKLWSSCMQLCTLLTLKKMKANADKVSCKS